VRIEDEERIAGGCWAHDGGDGGRGWGGGGLLFFFRMLRCGILVYEGKQ